jgi:hypothetical protein
VNQRRADGPPNPDSFANLNIYMILQMDVYSYGDGPLNDRMISTYADDRGKGMAILDAWRKLLKEDVVKFNGVLTKNNLPALTVPSELRDPPPPPTG